MSQSRLSGISIEYRIESSVMRNSNYVDVEVFDNCKSTLTILCGEVALHSSYHILRNKRDKRS